MINLKLMLSFKFARIKTSVFEMSEKTEVDQEYDDGNASPASLKFPEHQYTRVCPRS